MNVAIVGAGIAGLSCGYKLVRAGLKPVVFESEAFAGGRTHAHEKDGFVMDTGAYTIPEFHKKFLALVDELGLSGDLVEAPGNSVIYKEGWPHPMEIGTPVDFMRLKLLPFKSKVRLVKIFMRAVSLGKHLDLNRPDDKTFQLEQESAAEYLLRNGREDLLTHIAWPVFSELFLGNPEKNSKAAFLATIRKLVRFKIFCFNSGMGTVARKLAEKMTVRFNTPVVGVNRNMATGAWRVDWGGESPGSGHFDHIVFALPPPLVPDIYTSLSSLATDLCRGVVYEPCLVVALALKKPPAGSAMICAMLREEFPHVATVIFDHLKGSGRVPQGKGLLTAILSADASRKLYKNGDGRIRAVVLDELSSLWPELQDDLLFAEVFRWQQAAVQLPEGALRAQVRLRDLLKKEHGQLHFIGDGYFRASMEIGVVTGYGAADRILA
ncbi:MAG: NAD(P)-binding protein [Deltaproteobacteria bacterium]|jgi:protoporphyrinogen/coproporphyrinogen III oxidase|nr:NAD(P)-binding protein [Deltaproteobacteria bacterium]